jgi:hypothetical protein
MISHSVTDQISVQSDSSLGHQGAKTENTKGAINPEIMAGIFYHILQVRIHDIDINPGF